MRVTILGGGGMGKTSLAKAALHHPKIVAKFEHRYFGTTLPFNNMETPWEPMQSRGGVEEFLSLLADIPHLALMTMKAVQISWLVELGKIEKELHGFDRTAKHQPNLEADVPC
ncbi:hypothetical protein B0H14DRAFT_2564182 [Mycena olivaceomarginata]|nr:hypothetical protein B0H14DRAFT_2564182 [Mycena olivaceomarginata]